MGRGLCYCCFFVYVVIDESNNLVKERLFILLWRSVEKGEKGLKKYLEYK